MKRTLIYALLALVLLTGCGGKAGTPLSFVYGGITITPGAEAGPILYDLGQPIATVQSASCAFEGLDTTYYHQGLYINTFQQKGTEYILKAWFADDTVATAEGVRIGMPSAEAEKLLGAEFQNGALLITSGGTELSVLAEGGKVTAVTYSLILS